MPTQGLLVEELSRTISQATAPAFLIGSLVAFMSVLIGRQNRIADRYIALATDKHDGPPTGQSEGSISSLRHRTKLLRRAIKCALVGAISVTFVIITSFASAAVGLNQVYGAALLFILALCFF